MTKTSSLEILAFSLAVAMALAEEWPLLNDGKRFIDR